MNNKICVNKKLTMAFGFLVFIGLLFFIVYKINNNIASKSTKAAEESCRLLSDNKISAGCCSSDQPLYRCAVSVMFYDYSINCKDKTYMICSVLKGCDNKTGLCKSNNGSSLKTELPKVKIISPSISRQPSRTPTMNLSPSPTKPVTPTSTIPLAKVNWIELGDSKYEIDLTEINYGETNQFKITLDINPLDNLGVILKDRYCTEYFSKVPYIFTSTEGFVFASATLFIDYKDGGSIEIIVKDTRGSTNIPPREPIIVFQTTLGLPPISRNQIIVKSDSFGNNFCVSDN